MYAIRYKELVKKDEGINNNMAKKRDKKNKLRVFTMATKSANLYARIEPDVKEQAEGILAALGIPASNAINMFYKQIIVQRGLPFELMSPENASGQLDRLEACILSCSIYSG